jgi:hypothetical protein
MNTLFIAWREPLNRKWIPVAKLRKVQDEYELSYTEGAKSQNFKPFPAAKDLGKIYYSRDLFSWLSNRLLNERRPEYETLLGWLNLNKDQANPLSVLALTEGRRETDEFEIFPCPEKDEQGKYSAVFFAHGINYLPEFAQEAVKKLKKDEKLFLMKDLQNSYDRYAIAIRSKETIVVGYAPRYLCEDFRALLEEPEKVFLSVQKANPDAPMQLRLLCKIEAPWPQDFKPCSQAHFNPMAGHC